MIEQYLKGHLSPGSESRAKVFQNRRIAYGKRNR